MEISTEKYYEKKIGFYKALAFTLVSIGFLFFVFGSVVLIIDLIEPSALITLLSRLSDLGQFFSGTVAAFWALAGLIFIYIGFLHQQFELVLNRTKETEEKKQKEIETLQEKVSEFNDELNELKREYKENIKYFEFREYKGLKALEKLFVTLKNKFHENIKQPFDITDNKLSEEQYYINQHKYYIQVRSLINIHLNEHSELRKCLVTLSKIFSLIVNSEDNIVKDKLILLRYFHEELVTVEKLYFFYYFWLLENIKLKTKYNYFKMYESLYNDLNRLLHKDDITIFINPSE